MASTGPGDAVYVAGSRRSARSHRRRERATRTRRLLLASQMAPRWRGKTRRTNGPDHVVRGVGDEPRRLPERGRRVAGRRSHAYASARPMVISTRRAPGRADAWIAELDAFDGSSDRARSSRELGRDDLMRASRYRTHTPRARGATDSDFGACSSGLMRVWVARVARSAARRLLLQLDRRAAATPPPPRRAEGRRAQLAAVFGVDLARLVGRRRASVMPRCARLIAQIRRVEAAASRS